MSALQAFLHARDFLLAHREDYDTASRDFAWPVLDTFNWALDYFDAMAQNNPAPALIVLDEDGRETRLSTTRNEVLLFHRKSADLRVHLAI